ncbi:hypothetical protein [Glaciibacter flavus]|uniref:hypothetical protein n=1 Tax=Orlajensenia flava TaxID=2565934 RepID=UPI003B00ADAE
MPENSRRELAGTLVLRVPITTVSMKARTGDPSESERLDDGAWAGLLPAVRTWGAPVTAAFTPAGIASPPSVTGRSSG